MQRSGFHPYHLQKKSGLNPAKTPDISTPPNLGVQPNPPPLPKKTLRQQQMCLTARCLWWNFAPAEVHG